MKASKERWKKCEQLAGERKEKRGTYNLSSKGGKGCEQVNDGKEGGGKRNLQTLEAMTIERKTLGKC